MEGRGLDSLALKNCHGLVFREALLFAFNPYLTNESVHF